MRNYSPAGEVKLGPYSIPFPPPPLSGVLSGGQVQGEIGEAGPAPLLTDVYYKELSVYAAKKT
jgi:hypothetical protein